jgi:polyhydroxybutyrate depolymerase
MRHSIALFLALSAALPAELIAQTTTGSFMHDGILRDHRLYVPAIYSPGTPVPLVFNLHGYTSNNVQQEFYGDFRPIADTANFIIVHPNGTLDGNGDRFWNTFGGSSVDDLGYLTALLDTISAHYTIDADRVFSTGMSNGGFMSHDLACFRSDRFAAIASVTGTMTPFRLSACATEHPTPVMQIHGTNDGTVPYNGNAGFVPVVELMAHWAAFNNCDPTPVMTPVPDIVTTDGCTAEHYVYGGGDAGSVVELYKIIGGEHTWPGAIPIGVTNQDIDASVEIWRFFRRYRLSELQTGISEDHVGVPFQVGENPSHDAFQLRFSGAADRIITVRDATGRLAHELRTNDRDVAVTVDAPGLYLVTVTEGTTRSTQRLVRL